MHNFGIGLGALALTLGTTTFAHAEQRCDRSLCDYLTGAGCQDSVEETDTIFPMEVESLTTITAHAKACALWHGPTGCYQKHIKGETADLPLVAAEVAAVQQRFDALPEAAQRVCLGQRPTLSESAVDDIAAWCVTGQEECVGALQAARVMLGGMQAWAACVERMETHVAENTRLAALPAVCVDLPAPAPVAAAKPVEPRPLEVVEAQSNGVFLPRRAHEVEPLAPPEHDVARYDGAPMGSAIVSVQKPRAQTETRRGQVELSVAPFSGVIGIRDPGTDADYQPLSASVALGLAVVIDLPASLGLELGVTGRGAFASTALQQAATTALADLDTESGTAFVADIEPTFTLLSEYLGIGVVSDFRWDSIGITSSSTGLVQTDDAGVAGGMRLIAGYGLLKKDLRFLGMVDYLFAGAGNGVWRATLRAELGPALITGQYVQYFGIADEGDAHLVDQLQVTLGFRMVF